MYKFERKDYGKWNVFQQSYSRSELLSRRRQLAKVANSRIRSLERAKSDITGRTMYDSAWYNPTKDYLERQGRTRFSESAKGTGQSDFEIRMDIVRLENFLETKSSTVSGYRDVEEKRVQKFISKGVPEDIARSGEFYDFLNSETFETLEREAIASEDIIDIIDRASDKFSLEQMIEKFEEHKEKKLHVGTKELYKSFGLKLV